MSRLNYAEIVYHRPVERFLLKYYVSQLDIQYIVMVSPFIGSLDNTSVPLNKFCEKAEKENVPIYVITRPPSEEYHRQGINVLSKYDLVELRYNESVHAKLFVCVGKSESSSFALLGSGNLTWSSIERNIEISMMIYGRGFGQKILRELTKWGLERLRTLENTYLVKKITYNRSERNGV